MNKKKTTWLRILKITALILPAVFLIVFMPRDDIDDSARIRSFYMEEPDSLDVIVLGSSEDYAGYFPVLAYEEYGFTSYPYVFSANDFSLFKGQLEEVLRVQCPKIIVIDVAEIIFSKDPNNDTVFRQFIGGIPFSSHKLELIRQYGEPEEILSYLFPFFVNHGEADPKTVLGYMKTNAVMRKRGYSLLKGTVTHTGPGENWDGPYVTPMNTSGDYSTIELQPDIIERCQNLLDACKAHPEIQFVFINYPHRITNEEKYRDFQATNAVGELIKQSGYDFINFDSMTDEIGIVPRTDFYNNYHTNLYGGYKVTRFLCNILTEEYGLEKSQLSPENQEKWETCVKYRQLYYQLFDESFKTRPEDDLGIPLWEDSWLYAKLEEMKAASGDTF